MISSVTSAIVTATSAASGWAVALEAGGAVLVIGLLVALELNGATRGRSGRAMTRVLRVTTWPLLIVFAVSIAAKILTILSA